MTLEEACKKFIVARVRVMNFDLYVKAGRNGQHPIDALIEAEGDIMEVLTGVRTVAQAIKIIDPGLADSVLKQRPPARKRLAPDSQETVVQAQKPVAKGFFAK